MPDKQIIESTDLSERFAQSLVEGCCVLSCGTKGGGKSTFMCSVLRAVMQLGTFQRYVLVLPCYLNKASETYRWIDDEAKRMPSDTEILILDAFDNNVWLSRNTGDRMSDTLCTRHHTETWR